LAGSPVKFGRISGIYLFGGYVKIPTLLPYEHDLLANKSGINRLGFVVLLKYFQWEGRFPEHWQEVPSVLVQHMAATLNLPADQTSPKFP
jgi:hypothetical protein